MGTRSSIIVWRRHGGDWSAGSWARIYCHWDGYLSGNGKLLQEYYNSQERAEAVVAPGDLSSLKPRCDKPKGHTFEKPVEGYTTYYGRDRGEEHCEPFIAPTLEAAFAKDYDCEYIYVWNGEKWFVTLPRRGQAWLVPLSWALENEKGEGDEEGLFYLVMDRDTPPTVRDIVGPLDNGTEDEVLAELTQVHKPQVPVNDSYPESEAW